MKKLQIFICLLLILSTLLPSVALAQLGTVRPDCGTGARTGVPVPSAFCTGAVGGFLSVVCSFGFSAAGPASQSGATCFVLAIINILLAITGILAVLFLIIGGIRYITAAGNEDQVETAKENIKHAVIGLIIVILSFVVVRIIVNALISGRA